MLNLTLPQRFSLWSRYLNYLIVVLAIAVLLGWEYDIDFLKGPFHAKAMNPASAVCFILFAFSFWLFWSFNPSRIKSILVYFPVASLLCVAFARLLAVAGGPDFHIDTLIFPDKVSLGEDVINHMSFNSAFNFVVLGLAVLLTVKPGKANKNIANFLAIIVMLTALFSIIVFLYRVSGVSDVMPYFTMATYTALCFILAALTILFVNSHEGFIAVISSDSSGGTLARFLLPASFIAPPLLGLLRLAFFQWHYQLSVELGVSVLIIAVIIIFFSSVLVVSNIIVKKDALRHEAEEKLIEFTKNLELKIKNRTDEALKGENRFRVLIENSTDAIVLTDENLYTLYQSPAVERMTGISEQERRNNPGFQYTHPDDLQTMRDLLRESLANPGMSVPFQIRFLHKQGNTIWIEGVITNFLQDENVKALVFNYRDITGRKEVEDKLALSEQRFRALIENINEGIVVNDKNSVVQYQSPSVERILGYSFNERVNQPVKRFVHDDNAKDFELLYKGLDEHPGKSFPFQFQFKHKKGHYVWLEGRVTNLLHLQGVNAYVANYRDITERKEQEEKIAANEQRLQALIENSSEAITLVDEGFVTFYQSPAAERITGYTLEEREKISSHDLIHPDDAESMMHVHRMVLENPGQSFPFAYRLKHKNGDYIWLEGVITNLLGNKNVKAIVTNYRDITVRKEHEEKIAASEQRFRILIENNADVISLTDKNLKVIYQSPQGERITGYTTEERAALNAQDILHPDDLAGLAAEYPRLFTNPEEPLSFHYRFKHKLGHYIWLEGSIKNLLDDPTIQAIVVNFRDVSERKVHEEKLAASEQRFRTLIEHNFDCITLTNEHSQIIYQSPSVERVTGFTPEEAKKDHGFYNIHPDDIENAKFLSKRLREAPGVPIRFKLRLPRKDGEYIWTEGISTNLLNDSRIHAIVTNFRDVTESKISEREILKLNAELEDRVLKRTTELQAVNKELESFSYSISHDLRAPLRIINGFGQILVDDYYQQLDENGQKIIDRIMRNARKMGQLIDDLLNFSRLGRSEMRLVKIDMGSLVQEVLQDLSADGISLPVNLRIHELKPCRCDGPLIKQVLVNLISNAIKYSGGKENPEIEIGMTDSNPSAYYIKDNGAGFDMSYVHKLFGVFQRLHKAEEFEGTGVGLAIVQRVVVRHGGKVWAEAKENQGATFYFTIPD